MATLTKITPCLWFTMGKIDMAAIQRAIDTP